MLSVTAIALFLCLAWSLMAAPGTCVNTNDQENDVVPTDSKVLERDEYLRMLRNLFLYLYVVPELPLLPPGQSSDQPHHTHAHKRRHLSHHGHGRKYRGQHQPQHQQRSSDDNKNLEGNINAKGRARTYLLPPKMLKGRFYQPFLDMLAPRTSN